MEFRFIKEASYLYDLMQLPRLFHMDENEEAEKLDLQMPDYKQLIRNVKRDLSELSHLFDPYYSNEVNSGYHFAHLVIEAYPLTNYASFEAYFNHLLNQTHEALLSHLIISIIANDNDHHKPMDEYIREAKSYADHQDKLIELVKALPTEEAYRWKLLLILNDPRAHIKAFMEALLEIKPYFDEVYQTYESLIVRTGQNIVKTFNEGQEDGFIDLTQGVIPISYLSEVNDIYVSFVMPYQMSMQIFHETNYFVWGLHMDEGFKKLKEDREDQVNKRTQMFKLLGDKTRFEVLKLIASKEYSTKKIAQALDVSSATISYHINAFVTADILKIGELKGKNYLINYEMLDAMWESFKEDLQTQALIQNKQEG